MQSSLAELFSQLDAGLAQAREFAHSKGWVRAREGARQVLSAGSRLHARLTVLADLAEDADFVSSAAGGDERPARSYPIPLPGDQPLPFPSPEEAPPPSRGKRKARGA